MSESTVGSAEGYVHGALRLARDLTRVFGETADLEAAFRETLARICEWADWTMGQIWLVDPEAEILRCHEAWHAGADGLESFRVASRDMTFASGTGLPGRTWAGKGPQWIADVQVDPNFPRGPAAIQAGLLAGMAAPVFAGSEVVAVLEFFTRDRRAENEAMLDLVSTVAAQLGSLILRRQADEALRDSEARFRAVAETATDAIVLAGSDGLIDYLNRGAERMFGHRLQDVQGHSLTMLMPERFHQAHRHGIARFLEGGAPRVIGQTVELAGLRAGGEEFPMELSLATWEEAGQIYFSGIIRDITERKKVEEAKTMFIATASHELRTPLTVIQGFSELLQNPEVTLFQRVQATEAIARRSAELTQIVDRILLTSRIESGRLEMTPSAVDVAAMVRQRAEDLAGAGGREVRVEVEAGVPLAVADPAGLVTILDHLLENAVKYSPSGGPIEVRVLTDVGAVLLAVTDHGIGMTPEHAEHCFDRFWQAEGGDTRAFGGTGIGLFIVRSVVEAMEGHVTVESHLGRGSTFTLRLPVASASS